MLKSTMASMWWKITGESKILLIFPFKKCKTTVEHPTSFWEASKVEDEGSTLLYVNGVKRTEQLVCRVSYCFECRKNLWQIRNILYSLPELCFQLPRSSFSGLSVFSRTENYKLISKKYLLKPIVLAPPEWGKAKKRKQFWNSFMLQLIFVYKHEVQFLHLGRNRKHPTCKWVFLTEHSFCFLHWRLDGTVVRKSSINSEEPRCFD